MINPGSLQEILEQLGAALGRRGGRHELLVVGGSVLLLGRYGVRPTRDVDVMGIRVGDTFVYRAQMPADLEEAADDVRLIYDLDPGWLNLGPMDRLEDGLPSGYENRFETRNYGSLTIHFLGRADLQRKKVLAASDPTRGNRDMTDLRVLAPDRGELIPAARWALDVRYRRFRSDIVFIAKQLGVADAESEL